jgi:hypothetical protein
MVKCNTGIKLIMTLEEVYEKKEYSLKLKMYDEALKPLEPYFVTCNASAQYANQNVFSCVDDEDDIKSELMLFYYNTDSKEGEILRLHGQHTGRNQFKCS